MFCCIFDLYINVRNIIQIIAMTNTLWKLLSLFYAILVYMLWVLFGNTQISVYGYFYQISSYLK